MALVTGASRGLGRACARALAAEGAHVIAAARTTGALDELDDELRAMGYRAVLAPLDLTRPKAIAELATAVAARWGHLDLLLHAANRPAPLAPVPSIDARELQGLLALGPAATWGLIAAFDGMLRAAPEPWAIFVDDPAGPGAFRGAQAASKAALAALVEGYAAETRRTPLRVVRVLPPPMATASRKRERPGEPEDGLASPECVARCLLDSLAGEEQPDGVIDLRTASA